ncbi:DUF2846 domain-containing protein [Carboxylicivirga mesophila]|uniref:DUF2846 domain-containing protein n=1 Tax=Carboxylicivirga mesophila TaxID=1166478 RepID=A0ABS5K699_9BACT|nr:DUF2846 domain-containing protein [Carboxylicivirga mesophila]MBS2209898.1 DUF2846 domain-containing protein [Carboxylicivirga mesophila]
MKKLIFALAVIPLLIGCAGTSKAPVEHSNEAKQFEKHPEKGIVYVYRTGRVVGAAGQIQVKINGIDAGGTGPATFFRWELEPGTYSFMSYTPESSKVVELNVEAGQHYFLRQDARMGVSAGRVTLVEKDEQTGMKEVNDCKLLVSAYRQN